MKKKLKNNIRLFPKLLALMSALSIIFSCNNTAERKDDMSGMNTENNSSTNLHPVENKILPAGVVISDQITINPMIDTKNILIHTKGIVQFDERRNNIVSAYFGGRIEKLYVRYNYQYITKEERIMDIYSPELLTAQENYLFMLKNPSEKNLIRKAKEQLLLFGLTEEQIMQIEKTGKTFYSFSVFSNYEGYILFGKNNTEQMASNPSKEKNEMQGGMDMKNDGKTTAMASPGNKEPILRKGVYVNKGQQLFIVNDLRNVWIILSIDAKDASSIKLNNEVAITTGIPSYNKLEGKIDFIEPVVNEKQKFVSARVYIDNSKKLLKNNLLVNASIKIKSDSSLWIPNSSILDLGRRKVVWVKTSVYDKDKGTYITKEIKTGKVTEQFTEIISGLTKKDEIVKTAGYMNDSETLIQ